MRQRAFSDMIEHRKWSSNLIRSFSFALVFFLCAVIAAAQNNAREVMQILPDTPVTLGISGNHMWKFDDAGSSTGDVRVRLEGDHIHVMERVERRAKQGGLDDEQVVIELARTEIFDDGVMVYVTWYPSKSHRSTKDPTPSITLTCDKANRTIVLEPIKAKIREPESVVFVLDASGSMSGTKLESAKAALAGAARALPQSSEVALVVLYDCDRVTRDCDFTKNISHLIEKADAVMASGGTPLGDAMDAAFRYLHAKATNPNDRRRIVVLSDGLASCGTDPGGVAAGWNTGNGGGQHVAIIGLELGDFESASLRELARKADGKYIDATSKTVEAAMLRATGSTLNHNEGDR